MDMGKMIGPLPTGAWAAVIAGGLGIALYTRRQAPAVAYGETDVPEDIGTVPGVGEGPGWVAVPPPSSAPPGGPEITDNEQWARAAINYLIAEGYDAALSDSAIRKYIGGGKLSAREYALVRIALTHLGSPPIPLPPPVFGVPTTPGGVHIPENDLPPKRGPRRHKPPPKRGRGNRPHGGKRGDGGKDFRYHTVRPGDTLSKIAQRYYNRPDEWRRIYNANRSGHRRPDGKMGMIHNPNRIFPGWHLLIP